MHRRYAPIGRVGYLIEATLGATIVYTTDGSVPSLSNGIQVNALDELTSTIATVNITTTTTLRAAAFKDQMEPTNTRYADLSVSRRRIDSAFQSSRLPQ